MFRIKKDVEKAYIPTTIRFSEELNSKLKAIAAGENISFNSLVLRCCEYALSDYYGPVDLKDIKGSGKK